MPVVVSSVRHCLEVLTRDTVHPEFRNKTLDIYRQIITVSEKVWPGFAFIQNQLSTFPCAFNRQKLQLKLGSGEIQ